jgi:hypothetical protein
MLNFTLAAGCGWLTWTVWRWRPRLAQVERTLKLWERTLQTGLPQVSQTLTTQQTHLSRWQQRYAQQRRRQRQLRMMLKLGGWLLRR